MMKVLRQGLAADAVFDHTRGEHHAVSEPGRAVADFEILGEVMAKIREPAHGFDHFTACGQSWSEGKVHLADQPCHQNAGEKFRVHPMASSRDQKPRPGTARYGQVITP